MRREVIVAAVCCFALALYLYPNVIYYPEIIGADPWAFVAGTEEIIDTSHYGGSYYPSAQAVLGITAIITNLGSKEVNLFLYQIIGAMSIILVYLLSLRFYGNETIALISAFLVSISGFVIFLNSLSKSLTPAVFLMLAMLLLTDSILEKIVSHSSHIKRFIPHLIVIFLFCLSTFLLHPATFVMAGLGVVGLVAYHTINLLSDRKDRTIRYLPHILFVISIILAIVAVIIFIKYPWWGRIIEQVSAEGIIQYTGYLYANISKIFTKHFIFTIITIVFLFNIVRFAKHIFKTRFYLTTEHKATFLALSALLVLGLGVVSTYNIGLTERGFYYFSIFAAVAVSRDVYYAMKYATQKKLLAVSIILLISLLILYSVSLQYDYRYVKPISTTSDELSIQYIIKGDHKARVLGISHYVLSYYESKFESVNPQLGLEYVVVDAEEKSIQRFDCIYTNGLRSVHRSG